MEPSESQVEVSYSVTMTGAELDVVRTALEMLDDTLGREEADELAEVQGLLRRLPNSRASG
jgi:hypothetical protein